MTQGEQIEQLEDQVADLKSHNERLMEGRARRKERMAELWRENQRLKEAHRHILRMLALALLSAPGKRVEVEDSTVTVYDPARTKLCSERLLTGTTTAMWVEVDNAKETSP